MSQYDINFREYWRILKKRKVLVTFITLIFSIFTTFFVYFRAPTPLYSTVCVIEFERTLEMKEVYGKWDPSAADDIQTQITMVKSYPVFEMVVEKLGLVPQEDIKEDGHLRDHVIATIERLQSKVEIEREGVSAILKIRVTDANPAFAQKLANTIALAYRETHAEQQMRKNKEQLKYIVTQLADVRQKLRDAEDEVNLFAQKNELVSIDLQSESLLVWAKDLQKQIRKLKDDKTSLDDLIIRLNAFIKDPFDPDHNFYSTEASQQYQNTNDALVGLILQRETLLRNFTPKHPEVMSISDRIIENARKMSFQLQTQIMGIEKKVADLNEELNNVNKQTKVLMEKRLEFDRLKRKVNLYNEMTVLLERKNQEALIKNAEKPETVNVVKPALLPTKPINSRNTMTASVMSVVIGVILGFVIAFIVETFDTSLGAIEDVEETLGTKVLGVIPQGDVQVIQEEMMNREPEKFKDYSFKHAINIISHFLPKSIISESFRALRTNIQYRDPEKKTKTLAVTSSSPEEGKSMVATNLAITMAQGGMKTLLVGSDLRKPGIDRAFGVERVHGLTDVLIGEYPWRDTVKTVTDIILGKLSWDEIMSTPGLDNLHIITSGTPPQNPAELIDSKRFEEFIEEVKKEYDVIIFDSSPILSTADAAILGMKVDGVLLVYRVGSISKGLLKRTVSQLEQVQCNLMGVIINGMKPDISPDFQGYKYYRYYYSYGDSDDQNARREKRRQLKSPHLMIAAIACLAMGFLWQSGLISSFKRSMSGKPVSTVTMKPPVKDSIKPTKTFEEPNREVKRSKVERSTRRLVGSTKRLEESTEKEVPTDGKFKKTPIPKRPENTTKENDFHSSKSSQRKAPGSRNKLVRAKIEMKRPDPMIKTPFQDSKASAAKASGDHVPVDTGPVPASAPPTVVKTQGKSAVEQETAKQRTEDQAPAEKAPVEKAQVKKQSPETATTTAASSSAEMTVNKPDLKGSEAGDDHPKTTYSIQLGSFRTIVQAKNAMAVFRERGLSAYWAEVDLGGNEKWFRVYTGFFESREQAKRYKEKQNLEKSLVKETPQNTHMGTDKENPLPSEQNPTKVPSLKPLDGTPQDVKSSVSKKPKTKEGLPLKTKPDKPSSGTKTPEPDSKDLGSKLTQNQGRDTAVTAHELKPMPFKPAKNTAAEQAPAEKTKVKKTNIKITADFFTPFFGMGNGADLKKYGPQETYPKYPYSIQLGSFRTLDGAKKTVDSYRKKGILAYWSEVNRGENKRWFRVYTGSFESREQARKYRKENNLLKSLVKETPYTAFVGTYKDKKVLEDQTLLLRNLDYVPYAIEEQDGRYRLFIGAFLDIKGATEKQQDLESRGIQSQVIRR